MERAEKAGYNGAGSADFLKRIAAVGLDKELPQYLLTHPYSEDRVLQIRQMGVAHEDEMGCIALSLCVARARILSGPLGIQNEEIWFKKYQRDPKIRSSVYGAALDSLIERRYGRGGRPREDPQFSLFAALYGGVSRRRPEFQRRYRGPYPRGASRRTVLPRQGVRGAGRPCGGRPGAQGADALCGDFSRGLPEDGDGARRGQRSRRV